MSRPWLLSECTYADIKHRHVEVAVLPFGATEPHNLHLPYGTDTFESDVIADRVCEAAWQRGAKVIRLPTIPYGTETNQRECALSMNVNPSTLFALVTDLVESLHQHGVRKVVLLNSHGGNEFKPLLRELHGRIPVQLFLCFWPGMVKDAYTGIFVHPDDHAGEMETSVALAYFPELVARNADGTLAADDGAVASSRFEAIDKGWVSITRPWHLLTTNTGAGYPHEASAAKGQRVVDVVVERLAPFLVDLSNAEIDATFPFRAP